MDLDEATLVVRAREGDVRAFEALARRHQTMIYRAAVRIMGDPGDAEDALQDALVDGWRRLDRFRGDAAFATWMYRIVTHRCLDLLRRRRADVGAVPLDELADSTDLLDRHGPAVPSPAERAETDAGMAALADAVAGLREELRVCWVLRELNGLGYREIAHVVGASEDAVRGRIHRARHELAGVLRAWR